MNFQDRACDWEAMKIENVTLTINKAWSVVQLPSDISVLD